MGPGALIWCLVEGSFGSTLFSKPQTLCLSYVGAS